MNLENFTPYTPAAFVTAKDGVGYMSTVLVKAACRMRRGEVVQPLEVQLFPIGDAYPDGADPAKSSLTYASDFAPYKVRADILLAATAYRPAEQRQGPFRVALQVGDLVKQLSVSGRREFEHGLLSGTVVERESPTTVPIIYENAFGGPQHAANPVGKGHKSDSLPLIEYYDRMVRKPGDTPPTAGFGPISPGWEPRKSMVGSIGADYLEKYWPGFPGDFDERYFNAAPADQQVDGFLRGDEQIVLENLHSRHPLYVTQLPSCRVVCLREDEDAACELVPLVLDTLWINPDQEHLVLLWRGRLPVKSPDALEVKRLGFIVEPLSSPLRDVTYYRGQLLALIDERDAEFKPEFPPVEAEAADANPATEAASEPESEPEGADEVYLREVKSQVAAIRAKAGYGPEEEITPTEPPPLPREELAKFDEILAKIEEEDHQQAAEEEAKKWTREKVIAAVKDKHKFIDSDLSNLDLSACDFTEADFRGASLNGANFSKSQLTRAVLAGCPMEGSKFDSATLDEAALINVNGQRASFRKASLIGANLAAADLTDSNLDGANLTQAAAEKAVFNGASLANSTLSRANLTAAVLSAAKASKANFQDALLAGAACDNADFSGALFQHADISEGDFSASKLEGASLEGANAADADFTKAQLIGASFRNANCDGTWLSSAQADEADFQGAQCTDMQVDRTSAKRANFAGCSIASFRGGEGADLSEANFRGARGAEPIFESCQLDGADFSLTEVPGANFVHASLAATNFTAAELTAARFDYANCQGAMFLSANLFEANFGGANLTGADVTDANFFRVEFLDACITNLRFAGCNLNGTKLEQWAAIKNK